MVMEKNMKWEGKIKCSLKFLRSLVIHSPENACKTCLLSKETSAQCLTLVIIAHNYLSKLYRAPKHGNEKKMKLYFSIFHLQNFWDPTRNVAFGDENNMKWLGKLKSFHKASLWNAKVFVSERKSVINIMHSFWIEIWIPLNSLNPTDPKFWMIFEQHSKSVTWELRCILTRQKSLCKQQSSLLFWNRAIIFVIDQIVQLSSL